MSKYLSIFLICVLTSGCRHARPLGDEASPDTGEPSDVFCIMNEMNFDKDTLPFLATSGVEVEDMNSGGFQSYGYEPGERGDKPIVDYTFYGVINSRHGPPVARRLQEELESFVRANAHMTSKSAFKGKSFSGLASSVHGSSSCTTVEYETDVTVGRIDMWAFPYDEDLARIGFALTIVEVERRN